MTQGQMLGLTYQHLSTVFCSLLDPSAKNIIFNIVGGVLTAVAIKAFEFLWRKFRNRGFKKIFGPGTKTFALTFGSLTLDPNINTTKFSFVKLSIPDKKYSAENVASGCEIRASAYVASALSRDGDIEATVVNDESIREKLDLDFVSFGFANNLKTQDLINNDNNQFADFDYQLNSYVSRTSRERLFHPALGFDYGLILRIHPTQFPGRTWLACAGRGEWGTSGAAYFLGKKWREIARRIGENDQFIAIIKVNASQRQDESATLIAVCKTADELKRYIVEGSNA